MSSKIEVSRELIQIVSKEMDRLGYGHHESHAESILHMIQAATPVVEPTVSEHCKQCADVVNTWPASKRSCLGADPVVERQPVEKSQWDVASNPILGYADSYRNEARRGQKLVDIWSVITDLERNIAPLFTAPPELAELQAELADTNVRLSNSIEQVDELQATIARLTADVETMRAKNNELNDTVERLKGGQGEPVVNARGKFEIAAEALNYIAAFHVR